MALLGLSLNGYAISSLHRQLSTSDAVRFQRLVAPIRDALKEIDGRCRERIEAARASSEQFESRRALLEFFVRSSPKVLARMGLGRAGLLWPDVEEVRAILPDPTDSDGDSGGSSDLEVSLVTFPVTSDERPSLTGYGLVERVIGGDEVLFPRWNVADLAQLADAWPDPPSELMASLMFGRMPASEERASPYFSVVCRLNRNDWNRWNPSQSSPGSLSPPRPPYLLVRFRWLALLEEALVQAGFSDPLEVEISLDGSEPTGNSGLEGFNGLFRSALSERVEIQIANRSYSVSLRPHPGFFATLPHRLLRWSLFCGLAVTVLMTWMVRAIALSRNQNMTLVKELSGTQQELQEALKREQDYAAMKSRFVSVLTHEIRNPLGVILWGSQSLERYRDNLSQQQQDTQFRNIRRAIHRIKGLMEETLLIGRIERERFSPSVEAIDLETFCREICDEVKITSDHLSEITLQCERPIELHSDKNVLRHILSNLVDNALKYSPTGEQVGVTLKVTADRAVLRIRDHGIGIPKHELASVFSNFQRGSNVGKIQGTGLGLPLVKQCVTAIGGTIALASQLGEGTTVTVELPMKL